MRQSSTYTNVIEGNCVRSPKSLSKGKALIQARGILGPGACLSTIGFGFRMTDPGPVICGGDSWEQALIAAKGTPEAKAWSDQKIAVSNEIAKAVNSLNTKRMEIAKDHIARQKEILTTAFKEVKVRSTGSKKCVCGKRISANVEMCFACRFLEVKE